MGTDKIVVQVAAFQLKSLDEIRGAGISGRRHEAAELCSFDEREPI